MTASRRRDFAPSRPATSSHLTFGFSVTMAPTMRSEDNGGVTNVVMRSPKQMPYPPGHHAFCFSLCHLRFSHQLLQSQLLPRPLRPQTQSVRVQRAAEGYVAPERQKRAQKRSKQQVNSSYQRQQGQSASCAVPRRAPCTDALAPPALLARRAPSRLQSTT